MNKKFFFMAACAAALTLVSCESNNGADPVGTTYPRVQLIEHFTGADCGYCPGGMDYIYEAYSQDQDNMVWVSNHYGFGSDEYSIKESTTIGKKLGVNGAPMISVNRYKYTNSSAGYTNAKSYHPYYISSVLKKQDKTATSCVSLERKYDAATGILHVKATVKTSEEELPSVFLTVGVTESGTVGRQSDYESSWEGWDEFTHTHTIRCYATAALGDEVIFQNRVATAEYDIEINSKWVAENCELVAWITNDTYMPVLNAAKLPVVDGTQGGENIKHGGVTMTPVADTYPENGAPVASFELEAVQTQIKTSGDLTYCYLFGYNQAVDCGAYSTYGTMFPGVELYIVLPTGTTELPAGTYSVASTLAENTVIAGSRNDEALQLEGSLLDYLLNYSGKQYVIYQWMLAGGTLTVTADGLSFTGNTKNGSNVSFSYSAATSTVAPLRIAAKPARAEYMLVNEGPAARLF